MLYFSIIDGYKNDYLTAKSAHRVILSGTARTGKRDSVTTKNCREVEPRRGARRRDLRGSEAPCSHHQPMPAGNPVTNLHHKTPSNRRGAPPADTRVVPYGRADLVCRYYLPQKTSGNTAPRTAHVPAKNTRARDTERCRAPELFSFFSFSSDYPSRFSFVRLSVLFFCQNIRRGFRSGRSRSKSQIVPETVSVAVPGVVTQTPSVPCVYVAAGTAIRPGTVANTPVVSS